MELLRPSFAKNREAKIQNSLESLNSITREMHRDLKHALAKKVFFFVAGAVEQPHVIFTAESLHVVLQMYTWIIVVTHTCCPISTPGQEPWAAPPTRQTRTTHGARGLVRCLVKSESWPGNFFWRRISVGVKTMREKNGFRHAQS